jgi:DNA polymerase III subunit delta'
VRQERLDVQALDPPEQHDTLHGVRAPVETAVLRGHDRQAELIAQAYRLGRMHHALLLEGPPGIGKASFAFQLAQHLIANPSAADAPGAFTLLERNSNDFRQLAQGTHGQVLHLTRPFDPKTEKFKTMLTVDEVRRIGHFLSRTNPGAGYRTVIIDPVNDMNASASNALLKNLEEPPARTLFILVAHTLGRVLPTIRSRCQHVLFSALGDADLAEAAGEAAGSPVPADEMQKLAALAEGSVRRALLLRQFGGLEVTETADALIAGRVLDVEKAAKLGDVLTAREAEIQYQLLTDHLLHRIAKAAERHAAAGLAGKAEAMARSFSETRDMLAKASGFNLDRKQTVFGLIAAMHAKSRAGLL